MPYKPNKLRMKREAISKKRSVQGKYGNEVKRRMMRDQASGMEVVGGFTTFGSLGEHTVDLLDCGDPKRVWMRVDGEIRCPRTADGIVRVLGKWLWRKAPVAQKKVLYGYATGYAPTPAKGG